jgi:hypothetical protein
MLRALSFVVVSAASFALTGCIATVGGIVGSRMSGPDRYSPLPLADLRGLPTRELVSVRDTTGTFYSGAFVDITDGPVEMLIISDQGTRSDLRIPISSLATAMRGRRTSYAGRGFLLGLAADVVLVIIAVRNIPPW